ncbi:hypothetical protein GCM10009416_10240 [Craurococcus roseus]|uniref:Uncharacterized protein n=1 Tax=Craurococcus roseus TaxID=77585 RepID=A0ABN1ESN2_9PROT
MLARAIDTPEKPSTLNFRQDKTACGTNASTGVLATAWTSQNAWTRMGTSGTLYMEIVTNSPAAAYPAVCRTSQLFSLRRAKPRCSSPKIIPNTAAHTSTAIGARTAAIG